MYGSFSHVYVIMSHLFVAEMFSFANIYLDKFISQVQILELLGLEFISVMIRIANMQRASTLKVKKCFSIYLLCQFMFSLVLYTICFET